jgi:hypothetical protein
MARPENKTELLDAAQQEFTRLWDAVDLVSFNDRDRPGACDAWSVKDLLAHLHAWHEMTLSWEAVGVTAGRPAIPAPGYTFAQTPELNETIFQRTKNDSWEQVVERLLASHRRLLDIIEGYRDEDLFTKKRYTWTGSTSVGAYMVSATSSHYAWASNLIRRLAKRRSVEHPATD